MATKKAYAKEDEPKRKKKKRVGPEDIEGWDLMNPMERHRALALANATDDEGKIIPASDFDIDLQFLKIPDLCVQWALSRPGYAMGRIQALMGFEGSSKTSWQLWLANLTLAQGGMAAAVFVEHADSTTHMANYIQPEFMPYFMCYPCETLEEAIKTSYRIQDDFAEIDPEGKIIKFQIFDSVAGATQEKLLDEEHEPGAPKPGGIGGIMADFVNAMKTRIVRTNTLWGVNNQARDGIQIGFSGAPMPEIEKLVAKGGRALPFHATYNQVVKRMGALRGTSDMTSTGKIVEGFSSKMTFKKNKLGMPMRDVQYDVVWGRGFLFQPYTMDFLSAGKILGLTSRAGGNKGTLYFSKEMGVKTEAALSETEMYQAIHSEEWMPKFQRELGVVTEVAASSGREARPAGWKTEDPPPPPA